MSFVEFLEKHYADFTVEVDWLIAGVVFIGIARVIRSLR